MSDCIIKVENLGKRYTLPHKGKERYTTLRDVIARQAVAPFRAIGQKMRAWSGQNGSHPEVSTTFSSSNKSVENFWALKDVSFEVKQGDVVGIIGRNGAGKSTILKILSRITEPTEGRIRIKGRVASLLEVGTGFHPELTGRENIFLNGAILGMTRLEIKRKFDEIVEFAEVENFLDTPVKRYSSGMYVRLAFAVAAHLEPEILIVDEVLAVGDVQFQKKCLGKMQDVSTKEGRSVLFVSHNMAVMQQLCSTALFLEAGSLKFQGETQAAVDLYLRNNDTSQGGQVDLSRWTPRRGGDDVRIQSLKFLTLSGTQKSEFIMGEPVRIQLEVQYNKEVVESDVGFALLTNQRQALFASAFSDYRQLEKIQPGRVIYTATMDPCQLMPGTYIFSLAVTRKGGEAYDFVDDVPGFSVLPIQSENSVTLDYRWGSLFFRFPWKAEPLAVNQANPNGLS
jgi:lipopolysaccharide transport system ATP-binding protein